MTTENLLKTESNFFIDDYEEISDLMVKFAKHHVDQTLISASENAAVRIKCNNCSEYHDNEVDKDSILNSYPLTNIL